MSWKYSKFFKRRIIDEYVAGADTRTLADKHKITTQSVRSIVKQAGVLRPRPVTAKQRLIELSTDGLSIKELARVAGVSRQYARDIARECGLRT